MYVSGNEANGLSSCPDKDEPISGTFYLQGKMCHMVNRQECPSTMLHSFDARQEDGSMTVFTHTCKEGEEGMLMTEDEQYEFSRNIYMQQLKKVWYVKNDISYEKIIPDFANNRNCWIWIKADTNYSAAEDFKTEEKWSYMEFYYGSGRFPVIAYISLYDKGGNECEWRKGGEYTAKIHYGSVLPGQKMEVEYPLEHDELVKELYDSYENLDTYYIKEYLDKNLVFRSENIDDPIITRDEYLYRSRKVNKANLKSIYGTLKAKLIHDADNGDYIELHYPTGEIDKVEVTTSGGLITSINIVNVKKMNTCTTVKEELMNMFFNDIRPLAESQYDIMLETLGVDYPNIKGLIVYGMILQALRQHCREDLIRRMRIHEGEDLSLEQAESVAKFVSVMMIAKNLGLNNSEEFERYAHVLGYGLKEKPMETSGEFGYDATNPIPVNGVPANGYYLSKLNTNDGKTIKWDRIGSITVDTLESPVDCYSISDETGSPICTLHLYPYVCRTSNIAPKGFIINN